MFLYIGTILLGDIGIILCNIFFVMPNDQNLTVWKVILFTEILTVAVIAIDGFFAFLVRRLLPEKWFAFETIQSRTKQNKAEKKFWQLLGIKFWKDKIIDLGMFTNFAKSKIADPNDPEYIKQYIVEAYFGVYCHIADVIFGYLVILVIPKYALTMGLPVAIINGLLNFLPVGSLRYNIPRLFTLLKFTERKQKSKDLNKENQNV